MHLDSKALTSVIVALLSLVLVSCGGDTSSDDGGGPDTGGAADTGFDGAQDNADTNPSATQALAPSRLAAGYMHTCWLNDDKSVECWGLGDEPDVNEDQHGFDFDQAIAPQGTFDQVVSGWHYSCALSTDGTTTCWGVGSDPDAVEENSYDFDQDQAVPPATEFSQIVAGALFACGLSSDGVECWGHPETAVQIEDALQGDVQQLSAGWEHACAVTANNQIVCGGLGSDPTNNEGEEDFDQAIAPEGTNFIQVSAAGNTSCALRSDGTVECWGLGSDRGTDEGSQDFDQAVPPSGTYTRLAVGLFHTCALRDDKTVVCWGVGDDLNTVEDQQSDADQSVPLEGTFDDLASGAAHTCGIRPDGTVACWGWNVYAQSDPANINAGDDCQRLAAHEFDRYACSFLCQTGCRDGQGCYVGQNPQVGKVTTCAPQGSGTQGEACSSAATCAPGYGCAPSGTGTACFQYCRTGSDEEPGCPAGLSCVEQGDGFGVCQ